MLGASTPRSWGGYLAEEERGEKFPRTGPAIFLVCETRERLCPWSSGLS